MSKAYDFCIQFKLHASQVTELLVAYSASLTSFEYDDPHLALLSEHLKDTFLTLVKFDRELQNWGQKTRKLTFNNSQALAFFLVWERIDTSKWPLANVLILDMMQKIDKRIKAPKEYA